MLVKLGVCAVVLKPLVSATSGSSSFDQILLQVGQLVDTYPALNSVGDDTNHSATPGAMATPELGPSREKLRNGRVQRPRKDREESPKEKEFDKAVEENVGNTSISEDLNNQTIRKAIRDRINEAVDDEVAEKLETEGRLPSTEELDDKVSKELREIWDDLLWARRHKRQVSKRPNIQETVTSFEWILSFVACVFFLGLLVSLMEWPTTRVFHGAALAFWVLMGVGYNFAMFMRLGKQPAIVWLIGYILEITFSIENIFVFHYIVKAFRMPRWITQKVLVCVVLAQIAFQGVIYIGLAEWLRSLEVLPYVLGLWLLYLGVQAAMEQDHSDFDIMQTSIVTGLKVFTGDRLLTNQDEYGSSLFVKAKVKSLDCSVWCITPAGLLLLCLLAADWLLEVDVTITKIEGFPSRYLCFSSSMVAAFALPELFFIARDLFHRYFGLKYGISFVLCFVGMQALLHDAFTLSALTSLAIIASAMALSVALSAAFDWGKGYIGTDNLGPAAVPRVPG